MNLKIRRIGNSLGVVIPRTTLDAWGRGEGDFLVLDGHSIRPSRASGRDHRTLDAHKRRLAAAVVSRCTANEIRARSLANLHRWKSSGAWIGAYDEWQKILESASDGELFAVMLGDDERSNRLRQSAPYVGLLPRDELERLNEEASA